MKLSRSSSDPADGDADATQNRRPSSLHHERYRTLCVLLLQRAAPHRVARCVAQLAHAFAADQRGDPHAAAQRALAGLLRDVVPAADATFRWTSAASTRRYVARVIERTLAAGDAAAWDDGLASIYEEVSKQCPPSASPSGVEARTWVYDDRRSCSSPAPASTPSDIAIGGGGGLVTLLSAGSNMLAGNTGCFAWGAGFSLFEFVLASPPARFAGRRVIEIGCGCGLVGIALARRGDVRDATLTDGSDDALRNCRANLALNGVAIAGVEDAAAADTTASPPKGAVAAPSARVRVCVLDWCDPGAVPRLKEAAGLGVGEGWDVVLGADVTYDPDVLPHLTRTVESLLAPGGEARIAAVPRNPATVAAFVEGLAACGLALGGPTSGAILRDGCAGDEAGGSVSFRHLCEEAQDREPCVMFTMRKS